ncbi:MAG: regulatory protein RecX [Proteobacteria bacterium]|jgi:SOS response regulatory protein OraA/RecX|nr:regulatory protein RecX [Pseudomonadota bacterium]
MSDVRRSDIRRAAMDLLARREHSVQELQNKLKRRFSSAGQPSGRGNDADVSQAVAAKRHANTAMSAASERSGTSARSGDHGYQGSSEPGDPVKAAAADLARMMARTASTGLAGKSSKAPPKEPSASKSGSVRSAPPDGGGRETGELERAASLEALIESEVRALEKEGLQSDDRLAEAFVRARVSRGQGPIKIRAELRAKGVDDARISEALEACAIDWYEQASAVAEKRFGLMPPADARERAKRSRFLQQRGFSFDQISALY